MVQLSASILAANFACLGQEVDEVVLAGVDSIHFDVMDFHFVPNLSIGPLVCQSLRDYGVIAPIDVHLMVSHPDNLIEPFAAAGANLVSFHPETTPNPQDTIQLIKSMGMRVGLVFNPECEVNISDNLWGDIDLILLMSVNPGFGGQVFMEAVLDKISKVRLLVDQSGHAIRVGVDGGVNFDNMGRIVRAGADFLVMGSALFSAVDYQQRVSEFRSQALL